MKHLKIGIDIDNVIADSYPAFLAKFNEEFGMNIKYEEISDFYYLEKHPHVEHAQAKELIAEILTDEKLQLAISPYTGAFQIISSWKAGGCGIHYITSRPFTIKDLTIKWLGKHGFLFPEATLDLFNMNKHFDVHRKEIKEYKRIAAQKRGVNLFIEDSKEIAQTMEIDVLLLDRPWNQGKLPKNVRRVKNWGEIDKFVNNIIGLRPTK